MYSSFVPCRLIEIHDIVDVGIDLRGVLAELRKVCSMPLQEGIKVRLGSPVCIVDDTSAVCAFVQCCPDVARLIAHLFGEANPLIDECLLLLRSRIKDVNQCDQVAIFGNTHMFLLLNTTMHERLSLPMNALDEKRMIIQVDDGSKRRADPSLSPAKCVWHGLVPRQCGEP